MSQDPWGWYGRMIESDRNMQQQGMENLMGGINSAVENIAGAYMKSEEQKAKGRAFKNTFNVLAPALNMTTDKLAQVVGTESLKNDNDWYRASEAFMPILPSLINLQLAGDRNNIQQQGQQLATDRMYTQEQLRRERDAINNPPPPQPMTLPQGIRRFNTSATQGS